MPKCTTSNNSNTLSYLSLQTGEYEWEVDLGEYGEIRKVIGVAEDNLWVSVNDAAYGFHHLIALNINSGEVDKAFNKDQTFADFGVMLYEDRHTIVSLYGRISLRSWFYEYDAYWAGLTSRRSTSPKRA